MRSSLDMLMMEKQQAKALYQNTQTIEVIMMKRQMKKIKIFIIKIRSLKEKPCKLC